MTERLRTWRRFYKSDSYVGLYPAGALSSSCHHSDRAAECLARHIMGVTPKAIVLAPLVPHPAPAKNCSCGYYSVTDVRSLAFQGTLGGIVTEVDCEGIVQKHESPDGYGQVIRSQYQRIAVVYKEPELGMPDDWYEAIAERYGCEIKEELPCELASISRPPTYPGAFQNAMNQQAQIMTTGTNIGAGIQASGIPGIFQIEKESWFRPSLGWTALSILGSASWSVLAFSVSPFFIALAMFCATCSGISFQRYLDGD